MTRAAIEIRNVSKRFIIHHQKVRSFQDALVNFFHRQSSSVEEFWALRDVSFSVQPGEAWGIVGENGSGKSTMLKLITRILDPTDGTVQVRGNVSALIELGAGFHPDLTGRENIYLNGSILGFSRKEMNRKFDEIVAFSELERFIDTPVKHYSSGMYMRLGFSVAFSVDPDILIIDEVLAVGDEVFQRKCYDRIHDFRRQGKTIIFVSHGLQMVEMLCDKAIWLQRGVAMCQGPSTAVIQEYRRALQQHDELNRASDHMAIQIKGVATSQEGGGAGTSGVSVIETKLFRTNGDEAYSFRTGESVLVSIRYSKSDRYGERFLEWELRRSDGLLIHQSVCCRSEETVDSVDGLVHADLLLTDLPLLDGTYYISARVWRIEELQPPWTEEDRKCVFSIWSNQDQMGIVALPYEWIGAEKDVEIRRSVGSNLALHS